MEGTLILNLCGLFIHKLPDIPVSPSPTMFSVQSLTLNSEKRKQALLNKERDPKLDLIQFVNIN